MKKILNKISWIAMGLTLLLFTGCSDDFPEREASFVPSGDAMQVFFPASNNSSFEVEPVVDNVTIKVAREKTTAAATVSLRSVDKADVFTVPSQVQFAAGEEEVSITVSFDGLEFFEVYRLEIYLDEEFTNPYIESGGTSNFVLHVSQSDWADVAIGEYKSTAPFFAADPTWEQVLQYSEILDSYRFPSLYITGVHYQFSWSGGEEITPGGILNTSGFYVQESGLVHSLHGMISTQTDPDPEYTYYDADEDMFVFDRRWVVAAGSFGWFTDSFKVSEWVD